MRWPRALRITASFAVLLLLASSASAQSLSVTTPTVAFFGSVQLNGESQHVTTEMGEFEVTDSRALGTGWHLTVSATRFTEWDPTLDFGTGDYVPGGDRLPAGSLRMLKPSVGENLNPAPAPTDLLADPVPALDAKPVVADGPYFIDGETVRVATAAPLSGVGTYRFSPGGPLRLTVPASAYAVQYRSEITLSVADGP